MQKIRSEKNNAYLAGFLDGDGSIYVRLKPNSDYKFGFQVSPYVAFFQAKKEAKNFEQICSLIGFGYMRERKDGIMEYIVGRRDDIIQFLSEIKKYLILKRKQADLMILILNKKKEVKSEKDFIKLVDLIENFRELNYSKTRKKRNLTP